MTEPFLLSIVATSRNDNHGKNLLYRMQHFVDGIVAQCKKHGFKAELILVEWNPPKDRLPLAQALQFPKDKGPCAIRIISVPKEAHQILDHSDKIPLFQMIGKNVGIRRAFGKFVLATNIDILFSDKIILYLRDRLQPGILYRVDRLDVPEVLPKTDLFEELLSFCTANYLRINKKHATFTRDQSLLIFYIKKILKVMINPYYIKKAVKFFNKIHNNACGDFTLLSKDDWIQLRGYPEWNIFSWHLDSLLLYQAKYNGIIEVTLPAKMPIYHIEHGSGYTPESANLLFNRLKQNGIPFLTDSDLNNLVKKMKKTPKPILYNNEQWGMANFDFKETVL